MDRETRLKRLSFRAWHRGTREADMMMGGFFVRYGKAFCDDGIDWFERLLDEDDVDVMAWAIGMQPVPPAFANDYMTAMQKLDYIEIPSKLDTE